MIAPYGVVGVVPTVWGVKERADIQRNLDHLEGLAAGAFWLGELDIPVRCLVIPEGALQCFNDEIEDVKSADFLDKVAIDIPGPETDRLGVLARRHNVYVVAQAKARHPEFSGIFFNVGFIIDPKGEIILKHHKMSGLLPVERSTSPHDVYDKWVKLYGNELGSFWPVVDTEIGRLGIMMAMEGNYPENGRGLAMNGAEVVFRPSMPAPFSQNDIFEISNRARALENNFYVVAPNIGAGYMTEHAKAPSDIGGGRSMIVDYKGRIVGKQLDTNASTFVTGVVDIEGLRHHRTQAQATNWLKDVRAECAQLIYRDPIYPKNLYLNSAPPSHAEYRQNVLRPQIQKLVERGVWKRSSYDV